MRPPPKPGFWLVARREWRWIRRHHLALILIFGVPLFAFAVLTAVFSHPVIRGLGAVVVDADRSDTSRAFVEQVAASPNLSIVERAGDLASAARAIRGGDAIAAVYIPADFERDLKAGRRPQVVAFYNQQFLTAAGIALSGLSDSLASAVDSAASAARGAPQASAIGSLVAETIVLVNPAKNYAQSAHAVADGPACGARARRRIRGGLRIQPAQHAQLARLRGRQPDRRPGRQACAPVRHLLHHHAVDAADPGGAARDLVQGQHADDGRCRNAADRRLPGLGSADAASGARSRDRAGSHWPRRIARVRLRRSRISNSGHERLCAVLGRDSAAALVHGRAARTGGARVAAV